jgi:hypothetical protein
MESNLDHLPEEIRAVVAGVLEGPPRFGPGWTVCMVRDGVVVTQLTVPNQEQLSKLVVALAPFGYEMSAEPAGACDVVLDSAKMV